jgi:hypothetical protein
MSDLLKSIEKRFKDNPEKKELFFKDYEKFKNSIIELQRIQKSLNKTRKFLGMDK